MIDRPENPFGSRFTRPGALPFLVPGTNLAGTNLAGTNLAGTNLAGTNLELESASLASVAQPSESSEWLETLVGDITSHQRTAIVGPHGSGKTTLLGLISENLEKSHPGNVGRVTLKIHEPHVALWAELDRLTRPERSPKPPILIIDGFEQLGWIGRVQLAWRVRRRPIVLLVTAHQPPSGFRILLNLRGDYEIARKLTVWLLRDFPSLRELVETEFDSFWTEAQGNVRDLWAILYDWFESDLQTANESSVRS